MAYDNGCSSQNMVSAKAIPAVESALSGLIASSEYTENILGELLRRIERVSGSEEPGNLGSAEPVYSCSLACDLQGVQRRIRIMGERIGVALSRLEI